LTSPKDRLLDLLVFAPAGLALTLVEELPELAEKGRNRLEGQAATARVVGQFAVQMGCQEIQKRAKQVLDTQRPQRRPSRPAGSPSQAASSRSSVPRASGASGAAEFGRGTPSGHVSTPTRRAAGASTNGSSAPEHLAIPGYDTLSASQVVKRLAGLSKDELTEVGQHERSNRHRATILNRVEQLLSGEPSHDGP
jgi:hypothetical protein